MIFWHAYTPRRPSVYSLVRKNQESFCIQQTSTEARLLIRKGAGGKGEEGVKARSQAPTRKIKDAVDRHQNNEMLRQCPLAIAQQLVCYATAASTAVRNSHKDNVRSTYALQEQQRQKKSSFQAQLNLTSVLLISSGLT